MGIGEALARLMRPPAAGSAAGNGKGVFPARLSDEVRAQVRELADEGWAPEDIAEELGISAKSVRRITGAASRTKVGSAAEVLERGRAKAAELLVNRPEYVEAVLSRMLQDLGVGQQQPAQSAATTLLPADTAEDIYAEARAEIARQVVRRPEFVEAMLQRELEELGAGGKQSSTSRLLRDLAELRQAAEALGLGGDPAPDWKTAITAALAPVLQPIIAAAAQGMLGPGRPYTVEPPAAPALSPPAAAATPETGGLPVSTDSGQRLLGVFTPAEVLAFLGQDDPEDATDEALAILEERWPSLGEVAQGQAHAQLASFVVLPEGIVRASLRGFESDPAWAPAIAALWARTSEWRRAFREGLGEWLSPPTPEDSAGSDEEEEEPDATQGGGGATSPAS